jgi:hypothetical protein
MPHERQTVICVAGMHRSGTSMVTRLLNLCGMELGAASDLLPPSPANPEGYWEHVWFKQVNSDILSRYGGDWDLVPELPSDWYRAECLEPRRVEAADRFASFTSPVWGWKDPCNSLTLRFWRRVAPAMKVVVCLRNPLDVAASLDRREGRSMRFGLGLWWQYNSRLLMDMEATQRVVTHFDSYLGSGRAELQRVVGLLGMEVPESVLDAACKSTRGDLRHSLTSVMQLATQWHWPGLLRCYCKLLSEAGEVCAAVHGEWDEVKRHAEKWSPADCCCDQDWEALARMRGTHLEVMRRRLEETDRQLSLEREARRLLQSSLTWRVLTKVRSVAIGLGLAREQKHDM